MQRYISQFIHQDLLEKMVFLGGPRQVGKTTLAKNLIAQVYHEGLYFTWDHERDRKAIRSFEWSHQSPLVIFDELHKMPKWKSWIKGVYDVKTTEQQYLITGSARLDVYKKGGDSLMGRYHYWRLHPLTLDELPVGMDLDEGYRRLLEFGGFPEPFIKADSRHANRWRRERFDRIIREDIRDLEFVRDTQLLQLFIETLRTRVGSTLVLSNLARDLEISPHTAKSWLLLAEKMYITFAIYPYTKNISRSIIKPPKIYFFDNADVIGDEGARLKNLVATHLLKRLNFIEDYFGSRCALHYIRDKDQREVDFITIIDGQVMDLIEVKLSDSDISSSLRYYAKLLKPKRTIQLVGSLYRKYDKHGVEVLHPTEYFVQPPWEIKGDSVA